ncbi:MAG TPA: DNA-binding response regulator [Lachnospiraceae bacterium]|nr:DNA-binding response regulator [Lachnospiraceae bacterium]
MVSILIVEDEHAISDLLRLNLERVGYECTCAYDGIQAADLLENTGYDLIILDVMLPKADGFELMEYIRPMGIPVIFLTAKDSLEDRMRGLTSGAEDYMVKPFEIVELLARIKIILRRYHKADTSLEYGDIVLDTKYRTVSKAKKPVELAPKEFELLVFFIQNAGITLFREKIYEKIWGSEYSLESRTLDLHVQRLRKKLGLEEQLKTVYKMGYRLE